MIVVALMDTNRKRLGDDWLVVGDVKVHVEATSAEYLLRTLMPLRDMLFNEVSGFNV